MILAKKRGALSKRKNTEDLEWNELKVDILGFLIFFTNEKVMLWFCILDTEWN